MEEIISIETEALAKAKGCDLERCHCGGFPDCICRDKRITQNQLQKWLRDVHKIHVDIGWEPENNGDDVPFEHILWWSMISEIGKPSADTDDLHGFKTYEDALECGLTEALKLIK